MNNKLVKNSTKFVDERLVLEDVPWYQKQMIKDHVLRYEFAIKKINKGLVVDAACGSGYGSYLMASHGNKVIGVDISRTAIAYAQDKYASKKVKYLQCNVEKLPIETASVDSVVSFETLEHVVHYDRFLKEVSRVLRIGGVFIVSTPNILVNGGTTNPFHVKELTQNEFLNILHTQFGEVSLYGQKPMHAKYLRFVVWFTSKLPMGFLRWFTDSVLKIFFRGTVVKPIKLFRFGFVPAFFVAVCKK